MNTQRIDTITNWLMAAIVAIPFIISAAALTDLAAKNGITPAWLYPVMVDGGLIIFKAIALRGSLHGKTDRYAWLMATLATVASVALNVVHAQPTTLARFMSALPPLVILAAFVAVTRRVKDGAEVINWEARLQAADRQMQEADTRLKLADTRLQEADMKVQEADTRLQAVDERLQEADRKVQAAERRRQRAEKAASDLQARLAELEAIEQAWQAMNPTAQAAALYMAGHHASLDDAALVAGVSTSTISRMKSSLNGHREAA